ncbi:MAG: EamA family transporter [Spirochaetes bacterium]|nr:EamA family transporter [Spirochaetota bacterium]MBU1080454.1 EamA family transporter [Spirochaetota bacterium]
MKKESLLVVVSYALVYLVWGSTYFFIKAAVATIHPTVIVGLRFLFGAALLAVVARLRGGLRSLPGLKEIAGAGVLGILLLLLGNGLVTLAERTIPSWTASVVIACMPIYVAFFNLLLYRAKVSGIRLAGALAGVAGVGLLLYQGAGRGGSLGPGLALAVAGALSWAFGSSLAKSMPKPKDVLVSTSIQMLVGGGVALALGAGSGVDIASALGGASAWSLFSLGYLAVMGALALVAYNHLLAVEPSFRVSSYSLVNPLIAVALGMAAGEKASPFFALGSPLVLAGLVTILYGDAIRDKLRRKAGS